MKTHHLLLDGQITGSSNRVVRAVKEASVPEEIANTSNMSVFKERSRISALREAGFITEERTICVLLWD